MLDNPSGPTLLGVDVIMVGTALIFVAVIAVMLAVYAAVTVRDHGPGLAREHLPRLTERFYRVEGQKSGERQGTGLGLAIVKHIVNRHRGGLTVESAPGHGAAFTAYFPLAPRRDAVTAL